ncbi:DUF2441 domain-containing protein [Ornithinibacillus contaminans]|uniref:DUF2441 domain-containing protein n=1 Tax=Ornithinibacillus contaminans TaxID=694055 RepID=UPI00064D934A|nr:DUF2441 domain-containing protein [Ornithinibacillus contaminans]
MKTFFHLDRAGSLKIGETISLDPVSINSELLGPKYHINELFREGVSKHGLQYINQTDTADCLSEWFFEYVRKCNFNDKPSRFQSFFAFSSLEDINRLKKKLKYNGGTIYLIECNDYFQADMNLVGYQQSPLLLSWLANIYWSGNTCEELNTKFGLEPLWEYLLVGNIKVIDKVDY